MQLGLCDLLGCRGAAGNSCFNQDLSPGRGCWLRTTPAPSDLASISLRILLQKQEPLRLAQLDKDSFPAPWGLALERLEGSSKVFAEFPGKTPAARFILPVMTREAAPTCRKPLYQKPLTTALCPLCHRPCQQMDVLRLASLPLTQVPSPYFYKGFTTLTARESGKCSFPLSSLGHTKKGHSKKEPGCVEQARCIFCHSIHQEELQRDESTLRTWLQSSRAWRSPTLHGGGHLRACLQDHAGFSQALAFLSGPGASALCLGSQHTHQKGARRAGLEGLPLSTAMPWVLP